jgi:hypothetical protein
MGLLSFLLRNSSASTNVIIRVNRSKRIRHKNKCTIYSKILQERGYFQKLDADGGDKIKTGLKTVLGGGCDRDTRRGTYINTVINK